MRTLLIVHVVPSSVVIATVHPCICDPLTKQAIHCSFPHRAAAEQFAEIGANLILVARRAERLQELKSKLESAFGVCPQRC